MIQWTVCDHPLYESGEPNVIAAFRLRDCSNNATLGCRKSQAKTLPFNFYNLSASGDTKSVALTCQRVVLEKSSQRNNLYCLKHFRAGGIFLVSNNTDRVAFPIPFGSCNCESLGHGRYVSLPFQMDHLDCISVHPFTITIITKDHKRNIFVVCS